MSKNINSVSKLGLKTMAAMMLSACGGGGGGGESTERPESHRPVEQRELTDSSVYTPVVNLPERVPAIDPVRRIPEYTSVSTPIYSDISSTEIPLRERLAHRVVNINPRNNHFIESDNPDDNTHEYVFELRRDSQSDNLIDYTFSHEISGRGANSFSVISSTVDGHRYRLRVRYAPQDNSTFVHEPTLFVYAIDSQRTHRLSEAVQLGGYRPLNRSLSVPERVRRDAIQGYFGYALAANSLNDLRYNIDHGLVFSSANISQFRQDAWIDSRPRMHGQQFVFPFNVPLVQTYNPVNALFANQLAIKTYTENGDELFFVVQYKPEAHEIYYEVGALDPNDESFNTIIKHHALFSDGVAPMRELNITGDLSVGGSTSHPILIRPHDGAWSPAENNSHIKDKLFASESSYIVSKLSNISNISNGHKKIVSVNVLLNAADYSALSRCIASNMSGANFPYTLDVKRLLQDRAIPQVFKEAATAYNKLFLTYNMAADQQNITTPMPNSPLRSPMTNMPTNTHPIQNTITNQVNQSNRLPNRVTTTGSNNLTQNTTTNQVNQSNRLPNRVTTTGSNNLTQNTTTNQVNQSSRVPNRVTTTGSNNPTQNTTTNQVNQSSRLPSRVTTTGSNNPMQNTTTNQVNQSSRVPNRVTTTGSNNPTQNTTTNQVNQSSRLPNRVTTTGSNNLTQNTTSSTVNQNLNSHNQVRMTGNNSLIQNRTSSHVNHSSHSLNTMSTIEEDTNNDQNTGARGEGRSDSLINRPQEISNNNPNSSTMGNVNEQSDSHNTMPVAENINNPTLRMLVNMVKFAIHSQDNQYYYPFRKVYDITDTSPSVNGFNEIFAIACDLVNQDNKLELQPVQLQKIEASFNNVEERQQLLASSMNMNSPIKRLSNLWQQAKKVKEYKTDYSLSTELAVAYLDLFEKRFMALKIFEPESNDALSPQLKKGFIDHVIRKASNDTCAQINYAQKLLEVFGQVKLIEMYPFQTDQNPMPENILISLVENSQEFKNFFAVYVNATDEHLKSQLLQDLLQQKRKSRIDNLKKVIIEARIKRKETIDSNDETSDHLKIWKPIQVNNDVNQQQVKYNPFINSLLDSFDFDFIKQLEHEYSQLDNRSANNLIEKFFDPMILLAKDIQDVPYDICGCQYGLTLIEGNCFNQMRKNIYFRLKHLYQKIEKDKGKDHAEGVLADYIIVNNTRCLDGKQEHLITLENKYVYKIADYDYNSLMLATGGQIEQIYFKDRMEWLNNFEEDDFLELDPDYLKQEDGLFVSTLEDWERVLIERPTYIRNTFLKKAYLALSLAKPPNEMHYGGMTRKVDNNRIIKKLNKFYGDGYKKRLVNLLKKDMAQKESSAIKDRSLDFILYTLGDGAIKDEYLRVQSYLANYSQYLAEEHYVDISTTDDKNVIDNGLPDQFELDGETIQKPRNLNYFTFPNQPKYELLKNNGWRTMINEQFAITVLQAFGYLP